MIFQELTELTFISSELCNLNCSYCEIAKNSSHSLHNKENEKIKQAFLSGDYLKKYKKIFHLYSIEPNNIKRICLWGQEPTITLNEFATQVPDILKWLKNSNELFFSTNGVAYIDRIINLIQIINNCIDRRFKLVIQFSLDSFLYNEEQRGINPEIIIKNIHQLLNELNHIKIKPEFNIEIIFHGVITFNLIHSVLENNLVKKLWTDMEDIMINFKSINQNNQVHVSDAWGTGIQHPYNGSQQEGKELAQFIEQSLELYKTNQFSSLDPYRLLSLYAHGVEKLDSTLNFSEIICDIYNYEYDKISTSDIIRNSLGCGTGAYDIKMRYDGTLLYCQGLIFGLTEKELALHDNDGITYDFQKLQLKYNFSPNLLTSSIQDIEKFINIFDTFNNYSLIFVIVQIINIMYIALQNNQIDESYKNNPEKILKHAILLSRTSQCWYDQVSTGGSFHSRTFGTIRTYCNGFLDLLESYINQGEEHNLWK